MEVSEEDIYAQRVFFSSNRARTIQEKAFKNSALPSNVGTVMVEQPFTSRPWGYGQRIWIHRSSIRPMIRVGFDTPLVIFAMHYIFTIDSFLSGCLKISHRQDTEYWDSRSGPTHCRFWEWKPSEWIWDLQSRA